MARTTRAFLPGMPLHLIQRGANRQACFIEETDYLWYLQCLQKHGLARRCCVHAYVLMTNHVHLLLSASSIADISQLMKALGQEYAHYFNWRHHRSGPLWEGRYKSCVVQDETYLLVCQRYIELNPVRAGMVRYPGHYKWSSYRCNAEGRANPLIVPHLLYLNMGNSPGARQQAYVALFQGEDSLAFRALRDASSANAVVGNSAFVQEIQTRKA